MHACHLFYRKNIKNLNFTFKEITATMRLYFKGCIQNWQNRLCKANRSLYTNSKTERPSMTSINQQERLYILYSPQWKTLHSISHRSNRRKPALVPTTVQAAKTPKRPRKRAHSSCNNATPTRKTYGKSPTGWRAIQRGYDLFRKKWKWPS
jgi:hypothetical protein